MVLHVLFVRQFVWPRFIAVRFLMLNLRLCFTPNSLTFSFLLLLLLFHLLFIAFL